MDAGRDSPPADRQEAQAEHAVGAELLEHAAHEGSAPLTAGCRGEEAVCSPFLLVELDERGQLAQRIARLDQLDLAGRGGPPNLAPDLVAMLLFQRLEILLEGDALGQRKDGTDVFAFDVQSPAA